MTRRTTDLVHKFAKADPELALTMLFAIDGQRHFPELNAMASLVRTGSDALTLFDSAFGLFLRFEMLDFKDQDYGNDIQAARNSLFNIGTLAETNTEADRHNLGLAIALVHHLLKRIAESFAPPEDHYTYSRVEIGKAQLAAVYVAMIYPFEGKVIPSCRA